MGRGGMENCVKKSFFFHFFKRPFYISNHCQGPFNAILSFILIFQFPVASNTPLRIYRLKYVENLFPVGQRNIFFLSMCYFFSCRVTLKKGKKRTWKRKEIALAHWNNSPLKEKHFQKLSVVRPSISQAHNLLPIFYCLDKDRRRLFFKPLTLSGLYGKLGEVWFF